MSNAADKKRWAILPPPSENSAKISGEFALSEAFQRKMPARRTISGEFEQPGAPASGPVHSSVHELEPSDSERPTEVPQSDERLTAAGRAVLGNEIETIPAPALPEED